MPERPAVTAVIPTRDRRELVLRAVGVAVAQEGVDVEVVVVDDGSRDGTAAHVERHRPAGDVRVLRSERSRGVAAARNRGLAEARGEWVAFLDDDDVWAPDKLRTLLAAAGPAEAWACSGAVNVDEGLQVIDYSPAPAATRVFPAILAQNVVPGGCSNAVVRRAALGEVGGFDEALSVLADWDLWIRLAEIGAPAVVDAPLVGYVEHGANMHARDPAALTRELRQLDGRHALLRRRHGVGFAAARHRVAAYGHLGGGRRAAATLSALRAALAAPAADALRDVLIAAGGAARQQRRRRRWAAQRGGPEPAWLAELRTPARRARNAAS
jgi:GT2 family glycosyltransferase